MQMIRLPLIVFALAACTETRDPLAGTQSIEVELVSPSPGDVDHRLDDAQRTLVVNLRAKDTTGAVDPTFDAELRVYVQFLGTLTPDLDQLPLVKIPMIGGVAANQTITLPSTVFGSATLWIDNGTGVGPDYEHGAVAGTSPTLWYRDPYVSDLQRPRDEMAVDALSTTPLQDKQIRVGASRYGAKGALVITSTYAQGYTVSDVECATGGAQPTPPCTAGDYDHVLVFTFSAPRDQDGRHLDVGDVITGFNGGLSEFLGLTEVGFPRTIAPTPAVRNPALVPPPKPFDLAWFGPLTSGAGRINFSTTSGDLTLE
jgi:hypothetical protein